jgi:hypothetical protein
MLDMRSAVRRADARERRDPPANDVPSQILGHIHQDGPFAAGTPCPVGHRIRVTLNDRVEDEHPTRHERGRHALNVPSKMSGWLGSRRQVRQSLSSCHDRDTRRQCQILRSGAHEASSGRDLSCNSQHRWGRIDTEHVISPVRQISREDPAAASKIDDEALADAGMPKMAHDSRSCLPREITMILMMYPREIISIFVHVRPLAGVTSGRCGSDNT